MLYKNTIRKRKKHIISKTLSFYKDYSSPHFAQREVHIYTVHIYIYRGFDIGPCPDMSRVVLSVCFVNVEDMIGDGFVAFVYS